MKFKKSGEILLILFEKEEIFSSSINKLLSINEFPPSSIIITALGMVKDVEIDYGKYENEKVTYEKKILIGPYELLNLSGVINKNIEPHFHIHITLGDKDRNCYGGHLFDLKVHTFIEMYLLISKNEIKRKLESGLFLLDI